MKTDPELIALDRKLLEYDKIILPLKYTNALDLREEKEAFLSGKKKSPNFSRFIPIEYNPEDLEKQLNTIRIPSNGIISSLFEEERKRMILQNRVIINRGNSEIVRELSIQLYGKPKPQLIERADLLLRKLKTKNVKKNIDSNEMKKRLEEELEKYELNDWSIELSDKEESVKTQANRKRVIVPEFRYFSQNEYDRLPVHEIGVHALRGQNGLAQEKICGLTIFGRGIANYIGTEEGLASYYEYLTGNLDNETMRLYAGRVIAVDSVLNGMSFKDTFEKLSDEYGFNPSRAWFISQRVFRGGGLLRDHIYFEGYESVKKYFENGGSAEDLYIGKVGLQHLPLVKDLVLEGYLVKPEKIPPHFNKT